MGITVKKNTIHLDGGRVAGRHLHEVHRRAAVGLYDRVEAPDLLQHARDVWVLHVPVRSMRTSESGADSTPFARAVWQCPPHRLIPSRVSDLKTAVGNSLFVVFRVALRVVYDALDGQPQQVLLEVLVLVQRRQRLHTPTT